MNQQPLTSSETQPSAAPSAAQIDASCRLPLLWLLVSSAIWLALGSFGALLDSIKFHAPMFLSGTPWLTYGRLHPACWDALLYGFCAQAGLGFALWLLARLGRERLLLAWLASTGVVFWNFGLTLGILDILSGNSTGYEWFELPTYAAAILFIGYAVIAAAGLVNFHRRRQLELYVSQWYIFTALYWFAWIFSTAALLLLRFPVRGVAQAVIAWWYAGNLQTVWLSLLGLAILFYFLPKLTGRKFYSQYLALFIFWMLLLAGSWCEIPAGAPVPVWMPTVSVIARVCVVLPVLAVAVSLYRTWGGQGSKRPAHPALLFFGFSGVAFVVAGLMHIFAALLDFNHLLRFTWFTPATTQLHLYGFFAMAIFGGFYAVAPELTGVQFRYPGLVRWHFYFAAAGIVLLVLPLAAGGVVEAYKWQDQTVPFNDVTKMALNFLRFSTLGDFSFAVGSLIFLANVVGFSKEFVGLRATAAYAGMTQDIFKAAGAKP